MELQLLLVGTNHHQAPVRIREKLSYTKDSVLGLSSSIKEECKPVREVVVLSTCNRTEIYTVTEDIERTASYLKDRMSKECGLQNDVVTDIFYDYANGDVSRHLLTVTSGMDSLAFGEAEILSQTRQAAVLASRAGTMGRILCALFRSAILTGRRVRTETRLGSFPRSVGVFAVKLVLRLCSAMHRPRIVLVGAGKMMETAAGEFLRHSNCNLTIANRTVERAERIARQLGARAIPLNELNTVIADADLVLSCTSSRSYLITAEELRKVMLIRPTRPLHLIDIAVPRDIEPSARRIRGVSLYDIDDLQHIIEQEPMPDEDIRVAEKIIREENLKFVRWFRSLDATPVVRDLRTLAESIRTRELDRVIRMIGKDNESEIRRLDLLTRRIINKLLHEPTIRLQEYAAEGNGRAYAEALRALFGLNGGSRRS